MYPEPELIILTVSIDPTLDTTACNSPSWPLVLSIIIVGGISVLYPEPVCVICISSIPLYWRTVNCLFVLSITGV